MHQLAMAKTGTSGIHTQTSQPFTCPCSDLSLKAKERVLGMASSLMLQSSLSESINPLAGLTLFTYVMKHSELPSHQLEDAVALRSARRTPEEDRHEG